MNKEAYLRGYLDKEGDLGTSAWGRAKGSTRSKGSNVFDAAYEGVGTSVNAPRQTSSYITDLRNQARKGRQERQRFTPGNMVRTDYGVIGRPSISSGRAPLNKQTGGPSLKAVPQSTIHDSAGSRWEITPRADQISMYGRTGTKHTAPALDAKRRALGLSDSERVFTPDQRKALMHLSNTGQTSGGINGILSSRGIKEVNPVAKHTLLTDEQKKAVRRLHNQKPNNDPRIQKLMKPNDPSIKKLMERYGLEASEGDQQARTKRELDAQKLSDRKINAQQAAINKYVASRSIAELTGSFNRKKKEAQEAISAGRIKGNDPSILALRQYHAAITAKMKNQPTTAKMKNQPTGGLNESFRGKVKEYLARDGMTRDRAIADSVKWAPVRRFDDLKTNYLKKAIENKWPKNNNSNKKKIRHKKKNKNTARRRG